MSTCETTSMPHTEFASVSEYNDYLKLLNHILSDTKLHERCSSYTSTEECTTDEELYVYYFLYYPSEYYGKLLKLVLTKPNFEVDESVRVGVNTILNLDVIERNDFMSIIVRLSPEDLCYVGW